MPDDEHVAILDKGVAAWNQWRDENADIIRPDLSGADLYKKHLSMVNLRRATLCDANLSGAGLCMANLSGSGLRTANLRKARLFQANLNAAHLGNAKLIKANLSGADLQYAILVKTDLTGADLRAVASRIRVESKTGGDQAAELGHHTSGRAHRLTHKFRQAGVARDRANFMRGAAGVGQAPGRGLAQAMGRTAGEAHDSRLAGRLLSRLKSGAMLLADRGMTRTGSERLLPRRVRGPTYHHAAIATIRSASARISIEPGIWSNGSSTRSSIAGVWQRATTNSLPTTSHSSNLRQSGCGCALMSPRPSGKRSSVSSATSSSSSRRRPSRLRASARSRAPPGGVTPCRKSRRDGNRPLGQVPLRKSGSGFGDQQNSMGFPRVRSCFEHIISGFGLTTFPQIPNRIAPGNQTRVKEQSAGRCVLQI